MTTTQVPIGQVVDEALGLAGVLQVIGLPHTEADVQALIACVEQMAAFIARLDPDSAAIHRAYLHVLKDRTLPGPGERWDRCFGAGKGKMQ